MTLNRSDNIKKRFLAASALIGLALALLMFFYMQSVKEQLQNQSISAVMETTRQGCNTLRVQLSDDYASMETVAEYIRPHLSEQVRSLDSLLRGYEKVERGVSFYLPDGTCIPDGMPVDEQVAEELKEAGSRGIINPHINSVSGVNVFDLYVRVIMRDGSAGYLVKQYEVDEIVESFSLSFYGNSGFSYVINTGGDVLIRSPHPKSNKTIKNLFDMIPDTQNSPDSIQKFSQSLEGMRTGWAIFTYQGEEAVFCYVPLELQSDWYLISIIPKRVVDRQTNSILLRTLGLSAMIILGIFALAVIYVRSVNKTNRKLSNQASYIDHMYNMIPEGIALLEVTPPFSFIQLNREGLRLFGYPKNTASQALEDKSLNEIVHPDDLDAIVQIFQNTVRSGGKSNIECRLLKSDGEIFWSAGILEKTMDENGRPIMVVAFHDITSEKIKEEAEKKENLQERRTLVSAISNAYPVIISVNMTRDLISFIYMKPNVMMDIGSEKTYTELYNNYRDGLHPESREEFERRFSLESLKEALGTNKNEVFLEMKRMLSDNAYHWISTQIIAVDNPYSEDRLAILLSRRADEQRYEEEQRRQALQSALDNAKAASEAKSRFLSNMSHDIRTPMNAIIGMTAIAKSHVGEQKRVLECLKKIDLSGRHLLSLINDVLDMSKIESGKLSMREEPFDFAELVTDSVELVAAQAAAENLIMEVQLSMMEEEHVIGDQLRIQQVFINILSNAVKYTQPGGTIRVEARQEPSTRRNYQNYVFRCEDTGSGMSKEFMDKLFHPFEREQDSTTSKVIGTGLGMAITKNLVDFMDGDIQVESELGKGSVFTVTLPLRPQESQPEAVPQEWAGASILVVDDDEQLCKCAAEILTGMGLRVQTVMDGQLALKCVEENMHTPDEFRMVLADWKMPDMNGVELTKRIREKIGPDIPVVMLTAYDWSDIEGEAKAAGATSFMSKPLYRSKLCYLLKELSGEGPQNHLEELDRTCLKGKRVLLVEDNEINREIARTLISELGILVEEACDGEVAVEMVAGSLEGYYDMILMDIQMPKMNGYQAAEAIRGMDRQDVRKVPMIAMTANAFEEDVRKALRAGMDGHFAKPIDTARLEEMLCHYLSHS